MSQMFVANGFSLHYFDTKRYGELDFVMQEGTAIDLVEIKSGNDYKKHAVLDKVLAVEEWKAKQEQLSEGLTYKVDLSEL